ncbi:hypothetical protein GCM10011391_29690 [Pullulanibacillus camelliae]|uniref:Uncharacterized protein n=1 Tax=Pullulanibacillus camelliae TaxID=1707096 RepID=A0A8J3DZT0_9BACL|nr:hypothetical protein [Pullulanibacillus camelliae]GGE48919.1 hypothetical protein GCM10011391_29690 [Pullulanibacillus camelliae]
MEAIGTILNKNGRPIAIFQVQPYVLQNKNEETHYYSQLRKTFTHIPIVLISKIENELVFAGEEQAIALVKGEPLDQLAWKRYIHL